jgi:hypothetical protein
MKDQSSGRQHVLPRFIRQTFMLGIGITTLLFALLLTDIFYVQYPFVTQTGDANLQRWIGSDTVKIVGILLGLLFGGCYLLAALGGTREEETTRAWKLGAGAGVGAGAIVLLLYMITGLIPTSLGELAIPIITLYGVFLVGTLVVGVLAGADDGRARDGAIAGFWLGAMLALVAGVSVLACDALFASHLASTVWLGDHSADRICQGVRGSILTGCEVGDDLGFAANTFLVFPLLGLLLGAGGGVLGRIFTRQKTVRSAHWNAALIVPLVCVGFLLVLFAAEALWNLW